MGMPKTKDKKGAIAIIFVTAVTLSLTLAVLLLYTLVNARIESIHGYRDRFLAYYLCETGISVATLDFANGKIGSSEGRWTERDFDYRVGEKTYSVHYSISRPSGSADYNITAAVNSPLGLGRKYYLTASGPLKFPGFIRGFGGGR